MLEPKSIILLALVVASFGSGWQVKNWQYKSNELAKLEAEVAAQRRMDNAVYEIANTTTDAIANIRIENRNIYRDAVTEIREIPIYSECILPVEAIKLINDSRRVK